MKIGYFGGTFDPPHLGHVILAVEALYQLELDSLKWILTPFPPHKNNLPITPVEVRLEMLKLAVGKHPGFEISLVDLNRDPPHYAADTVEILRAENPTSKLIYLIGEDSLVDLPDWYAPTRFLANVDQLVVALRPQINSDLTKLESSLPALREKIYYLSDAMLQISSSFIRERIKNNGPVRHLLDPEVYQYLDENNLYQQI
ncbi:MAG: nicotinate (nicotinamide) nucleotide adenylyltransferase [Anaerolineales bacterium]|nr:nicotinate (nicotinamide) nucleotide adenylyltransferase [Anaerolineales bacterium]